MARGPLAPTPIADIRIYEPARGGGDGPPADPEAVISEILAGGPRPGGAYVSSAGPWLGIVKHALYWRLWEARFTLPGFDHVYVHPTSKLGEGLVEVEPDAPAGRARQRSRSVRVGVEPAALRRICRGEDHRAGIDLVARCLAAVAREVGADVAIIEAARAALVEHGLGFEVLFKSKRATGCTLSAYLALRPGAKDELVLEHRDERGAAKRVAISLHDTEDVFPLVSDLRLSDGKLLVVPRRSVRADEDCRTYARDYGSPMEFSLSAMDPVAADPPPPSEGAG